MEHTEIATKIAEIINTIDPKYKESRSTNRECTEDYMVRFDLEEDGTISYEDDWVHQGGFETINEAIEAYIENLHEAAQSWYEDTCEVDIHTLEIGWSKIHAYDYEIEDGTIGTITFVIAMDPLDEENEEW